MKIRLISHASVIIECTDASVWTDPWLFGKVFNDSWTLLPDPAFDESLLQKITHLWISHEHPDHFNFPTLASLSARFKENVIVLFQSRNSARVFAGLEKLGFRNFVGLPHRKSVPIGGATRVYGYQAGTLDSCLGIANAGEVILDVNDARINSADCRTILNDLGSVDVVLNQFSLAVTSGHADHESHLGQAARHVLESLSAVQKDLGARVTVPFASLMYWSAVDNKHVNAFTNKPRDVFEFCAQRGQEVAILYPGDVYEVNRPYDSSGSLKRYDELYARSDELVFDVPASVPLTEIAASFHQLVRHLREKFPRTLLRALRPLTVQIPDLGITIVFSIARGSIQEVDSSRAPDLRIHSQPLQFCFSRPYGVQTLSISGRFIVLNGSRNWRLHRALFALNNAEVYLRPRYWATRRNWAYLKDRLRSWGRYRERRNAPARPPDLRYLR